MVSALLGRRHRTVRRSLAWRRIDGLLNRSASYPGHNGHAEERDGDADSEQDRLLPVEAGLRADSDFIGEQG